jgi:hypothetical protein
MRVSRKAPLVSLLALATAIVVGLASPVTATPITSVAGLTGATTTIDFSQFTGGGQLTGVNGPVQIGAVAGVDVTVQDMSAGSNIWLYNAGWGLLANGSWDSGRNGFLGIFPGSGPVRISFNDGPVSGVGLFMNYPDPDFLPQTLRAFDSGGTLLELFDVGVSAPISTPGGLNAGAFRGIQLATASIAYIELFGNTSVYDNLTFTQTAIPEPASMLLLGTGLAVTALRRRRSSKRS